MPTESHAAGILLTHGDRALFLKRADNAKDHAGEWCCPGGSIEAGETPEQAARREMTEETGLVSGDLNQIDEGDGFVTFRQTIDAETDPTLNDEHTEFKWASISDPPQPLHPGVAATLGKLLSASKTVLAAAADSDAAEAAMAQDRREYDRNNWFEVLDNPLSKVGVYQYSEASVIKGGDRNKKVGVYRSAEELGSQECVNSFKLMPWTDDHPSTLFGDTAQGYASTEEKGVRGVIGEKVYFKGDTLYGNLKIFSEDLARKIAGGKRELSCGYHCDFIPSEGVFEGAPYQYLQKNPRGNHVSSVDAGRMGSAVRVLDSAERFTFSLDMKDSPMDDDGFSLDGWEESKHPRKDNGEFGNGSGADPHTTAGGAKTTVNPPAQAKGTVTTTKEYVFAGQPDEPGSKPASNLDPEKIKAAEAGSQKIAAMMSGEKKPESASSEGKKAHPFVATFTEEYGTGTKAKEYLETAPKEKLETALRLIDRSGSDDQDSQKLKKILERELDSRANRGDAKDSTELATTVAGDSTAEKSAHHGHLSINGDNPMAAAIDADKGEVKDPAGGKEEPGKDGDLKGGSKAVDSMSEEEEAGMDAAECAKDADEDKADKDKDDKEARDRKSARDYRRGARDGRKMARDKKAARDAKMAKDNEDDDKKGKGMDAAEVTALVNSAISKIKVPSTDEIVAQVRPAIRREEAAKAALYGRVSPMIGAFDHAEMTHVEMATYSLDKLGAPKATDPVTALDYLLVGRTQVVEAPRRAALDAASDDNFVGKYLNS